MRFSPQVLSVLSAVASFCSAGIPAAGQAPPVIRKITPAPRTLPLTEFYDTPDPLPLGKPGELIRFEPFDEYHLSSDFTVFRILYHSSSANDKDVAVSGVVIVPDGTPPAGGWPLIAWAHDFTGAARTCAPSLLKNLNEGPLISMYVRAGYAVVGSDYAGLGTNLSHAALDMRSNAVDVINSVTAARTAVPQLGSRWVVAGFSQGGMVSVGVSEAEAKIADPNYLGALAISGVASPQELYPYLAQGASGVLLLHLAAGIKTIFAAFQINDMLADKAISRFQLIRQRCDVRTGEQLAANELLKPGWENNRYVKDFFARNAPGGRAARGPLLLISGDADVEVPPSLTALAVTRLCAQNDRVLSILYPGLNASAVIVNSANEQFSWLRARFANLPAPGNCPRRVR
jgi:alpha-beta hydrolase superfamily lysophospholipase